MGFRNSREFVLISIRYTQGLKSERFHGSLISIILSKEYKKEKKVYWIFGIPIRGRRSVPKGRGRKQPSVGIHNEHEQRVLDIRTARATVAEACGYGGD